MTRALLWDAGPGEIRVGLREQGRLAEFRIIRPGRGRTAGAAGDLFTARVVSMPGNGKALVDLGDGQEAMLEPVPACDEGSLLVVEMTRAAIPEPGRWKRALVRPAPDVSALREAGRHPGQEPWVRYLHKALPAVDTVICSDPWSASAVRGAFAGFEPEIAIDPRAVGDAGFDELIEQAVGGEFAIAGGMLSIERTRAMTMIDIDGGGDPLALNLAAAREIPRLLRLLDIGGQIGIDFLALPDRAARQAVDAALAEACDEIGVHERTALNGFGFAQIVRPRLGPSLPELLCGTTPGRLSVDSRAVALLRAAGRSQGHGTRQLVAAPAIINRIATWPDELAALRARLGADVELVSDRALTGYGHVHVSQN